MWYGRYVFFLFCFVFAKFTVDCCNCECHYWCKTVFNTTVILSWAYRKYIQQLELWSRPSFLCDITSVVAHFCNSKGNIIIHRHFNRVVQENIAVNDMWIYEATIQITKVPCVVSLLAWCEILNLLDFFYYAAYGRPENRYPWKLLKSLYHSLVQFPLLQLIRRALLDSLSRSFHLIAFHVKTLV